MRELMRSSRTETLSLNCSPARFSTMIAVLRCIGGASAADEVKVWVRLATTRRAANVRINLGRYLALLNWSVGQRLARRLLISCGCGHRDRATLLVYQNIVGNLNIAAVRGGFGAPLTNHVIIRVHGGGETVGGAFGDTDAEAGDVAGGDADAIADHFAGSGTRLIGTAGAIISSASSYRKSQQWED